MKVRVSPSQCHGSIHIPPSKSMAHRAIICASLANGTSIISNVSYSQDIKTTIDGMRKLGAHIETKEDHVIIEGIQDFQHLSQSEIYCCESGSTLRFFIPIFSLCNQPISFTGEKRLLERPQKIYEELFHEKGLAFTQDEKGIHINASLPSGEYTLKGNVSSQFISGLLFTLPLLEKDSILHISAPFESKSYVELTLEMLKRFGIQAFFQDDETLYIPGKQQYQPCHYEIEGDYSQLAFFAVLAAIQQDLEITGVRHDSKQGDKQILSILNDFNVRIEEIDKGYKIYRSPLQGSDIDLSNCPDLGPILTVLAMYSPGNTTIYNAGRLRIKESDRIAAMERELQTLGVDIHSDTDTIYITGGASFDHTAVLHGHNDHRIVMALSIALTCATQDGIIDDAQAIQKSYPAFFDDLRKLHGKVDTL